LVKERRDLVRTKWKRVSPGGGDSEPALLLGEGVKRAWKISKYPGEVYIRQKRWWLVLE
jgi:hypothetical protein